MKVVGGAGSGRNHSDLSRAQRRSLDEGGYRRRLEGEETLKEEFEDQQEHLESPAAAPPETDLKDSKKCFYFEG